MAIRMPISDPESLNLSSRGQTNPLKPTCFYTELKPVYQIVANACLHEANSRSNRRRSKEALGTFMISLPACRVSLPAVSRN